MKIENVMLIDRRWLSHLSVGEAFERINEMILDKSFQSIRQRITSPGTYFLDIGIPNEKFISDTDQTEMRQRVVVGLIVRCKDCIYYDGKNEQCCRTNADPYETPHMEAYDYCSKGEVRSQR